LSRHPFNRDILAALASYESEAGDFAAALPHAELLSQLEPEDRSIRELVSAIKGASGRAREK
jgi:hypothetical protein